MSTVTVQKEMFLHVMADGSRVLRDYDMSEHANSFGVSVGKVSCSITYADIENADPRAVLIGKFEEQITKERAESQQRVNHLLDQIRKLQCIEFKTEAAA